MPEPREPLTEAELDALVELAGAATPGPWEVKDESNVWGTDNWIVEGWCDYGPTTAPADAAYIAAANPATVLRLVEDVRRLRAALDRVKCPNCGSMACANPTTGEIEGWMIPVPLVPGEDSE